MAPSRAAPSTPAGRPGVTAAVERLGVRTPDARPGRLASSAWPGPRGGLRRPAGRPRRRPRGRGRSASPPLSRRPCCARPRRPSGRPRPSSGARRAGPRRRLRAGRSWARRGSGAGSMRPGARASCLASLSRCASPPERVGAGWGERQIAEADVEEQVQRGADPRPIAEQLRHIARRQVEQLRDVEPRGSGPPAPPAESAARRSRDSGRRHRAGTAARASHSRRPGSGDRRRPRELNEKAEASSGRMRASSPAAKASRSGPSTPM